MKNFETARIFSDNMVLQFGRPLNVFGTGTDGTRLTISISGKMPAAVSVTVKDGRWMGVLPPQLPQKDIRLTVTDGTETEEFTNAAIGAVWLAGGQSNMELELQNCDTGVESLANDAPDVRFYYTQKHSIAEEGFFEMERNTCWMEFSKEHSRSWSAVGYYFAKELSEQLGLTVGIIGCNWGGTSASAWMDRKYCSGETAVYFEEYDKAAAGKTDEQLKSGYLEYQAYHAAWEKKSAEYYSTTPNPTWDGCLEYCGENRYPGPHSPLNPMSPGVLHESMVKRVAPYTMTGVLWYQGESDDHRPESYRTLLTQLISNWRDDWCDDSLFFVIGQLPMHQWSGEEDRKHWCVIREAQAQVCRTVSNTALAVLTDCGEYSEIHPKNKKLPGHRFFLAAMANCYHAYFVGEDIPAFNPEVTNVIWREAEADIYVSSDIGLDVRGTLTGFETAGADGVFTAADAELVYIDDGTDMIRVKAAEPYAVRYLWTNYTEDIPLFDKSNGVPLAPFILTKPEYKG